MSQTSIEWTRTYHPDGTFSPGFSVNPIRARLRDAAHAALTTGGYGSGLGHYCEKISPGCALCYASGSQPRFGMPEFPGARKSLVTLPVLDDRGAVPATDRVELFFDSTKLREVIRRKTPTRWFWCDQTDLFGSWVPDAWVDRCVATMALTPWHTHQVLTKRPERMAAYARRVIDDAGNCLFTAAGDMLGVASAADWIEDVARGGGFDLPLRHVWLGTSIENQEWADKRIPHLLACPAAVRFLSAEPLLGPLSLQYGLYTRFEAGDGRYATRKVDWVIVGGESGPGARPCDQEWVRGVVGQGRAAGVPVFVKQLGSVSIVPFKGPGGGHTRTHFRHPKGGDPAEWPEDLHVREFPSPATEVA